MTAELDMAADNVLREDAQAVLDSIVLQLITVDNITAEHRVAIRNALARNMLIRSMDSEGRTRQVEYEDLVEGRDWCFATSRHGVFGVFSLAQSLRPYLAGAIFHLWLDNTAGGERHDFVDLRYYRDMAQDEMHSAGVNT